MAGYTVVQNLLTHQPIPDEGILTRQVYDDAKVRVVMFTFSAGQRLSEHTASTTAIMHFLAGEATVTLDQDRVDVSGNTWIRMDPGTAHSVVTKSAVTMLLILVKGATP